MALVPLNIAPALRPWCFAGVTHLLLDEAATQRLESLRTANTTLQPAPAVEKNTPPRPLSNQVLSESGAASVPESHPVSRPDRPVQDSKPAVISAPQSETHTVSPDRWNTYWRDLLTRTPPQPALLWTYPSLSRDLGGEADESHRNFLRRLLGDMALPRGSHAFWPLNSFPYADGESEQSVNVSMFLSGVNLLNPDTVILMTGVAPPELGIDARLLSPVLVRGKRYVVTPHVDDLLSVPRRYSQLMIFLKALLR